MVTLEVHPGDGGSDAELFATELADAIARYTGTTTVRNGTTLLLHRL